MFVAENHRAEPRHAKQRFGYGKLPLVTQMLPNLMNRFDLVTSSTFGVEPSFFKPKRPGANRPIVVLILMVYLFVRSLGPQVGDNQELLFPRTHRLWV